jgi:glycosyltransferase involved in cell wall biosynthesis
VDLASGRASPIRIVRIVTRLNIGGPSIHVALLSTRLDPARFTTCLVSGIPDATEGDWRDLVEAGPVKTVWLKTLRRPLHPWADLLTVGQLFRLICRERPHLIHTHMAKAGALGRLAGFCYNTVGPGRRPGARASLIHTFHGHVLEGYFALWLSRLFVIIECWLARGTDRLIAVSPSIRDELLRKGIGRRAQWVVIPLGLELASLAQLSLPTSAASVRVGLVGRLVPIKNPNLFLEALACVAVQPRGGAVSGLVVGDGPLRASLERQAVRLGLNGRVRFTGWQRDLRAVYEQLDVVCVTSWNEGTPVSLIEAMAAGRAVVATAVGGVRDVLDQDTAGTWAPIPAAGFQIVTHGLLVRPGDVEGLAAALNALASDAALRRRVSMAARSYAVSRFNAERLLRDIAMLYELLRRERVPCTP